jgi:hypothetical protein
MLNRFLHNASFISRNELEAMAMGDDPGPDR